MNKTRLLASAALLGLVAASSLAFAGPPPQGGGPVAADAPASSLTRSISVTGTGRSDMAPDIAILSLGVTNSGATGREALDANSKAMTAVLEGLKTLGFGVTDIQTTGLSLNSNFDYSTTPPKVLGYQATNGVTLKVKDLTKLGEILDAAVTNGANQINWLTFDVADKTAAMNDARTKAIQDARAKAELMAGAAGASVGRVLSISEGYMSSPAPAMAQTMRSDAAAPVPIAAGQVGLEAQISVVFELN
jgi:uncharacterized protein YggE